MTSKEQFEAWLEREQGLYGEDIEWQPERNCYARFGIHLAWCAWQASREAIEIEIPPGVDVGKVTGSDGRTMYWIEERAVKNIIESEGLKVKGN